MTIGTWIFRAASRFNAYHRVDGANDVVALVKTREDAIAIAALPEVAEALESVLRAAALHSWLPIDAFEQARAALTKMRGIK